MKQTLTDLIDSTWQVLKEATRAESWSATREAYAQMEKLQEINESLTAEIGKKLPNLIPAQKKTDLSKPEAVANLFSGGKSPTIRPTELRLGTQKFPISLSNQIVIVIANWILGQGKSLPVITGFLHPTASGFADSAVTKKLEDGSYIEVGLSQETLLKKARQLLNAAGLQNSKAEVLLENGDVKVI